MQLKPKSETSVRHKKEAMETSTANNTTDQETSTTMNSTSADRDFDFLQSREATVLRARTSVKALRTFVGVKWPDVNAPCNYDLIVKKFNSDTVEILQDVLTEENTTVAVAMFMEKLFNLTQDELALFLEHLRFVGCDMKVKRATNWAGHHVDAMYIRWEERWDRMFGSVWQERSARDGYIDMTNAMDVPTDPPDPTYACRRFPQPLP